MLGPISSFPNSTYSKRPVDLGKGKAQLNRNKPKVLHIVKEEVQSQREEQKMIKFPMFFWNSICNLILLETLYTPQIVDSTNAQNADSAKHHSHMLPTISLLLISLAKETRLSFSDILPRSRGDTTVKEFKS